MPKVKVVKQTKCRCCGCQSDPTVLETDNRMYYVSQFGTVEYDPTADYGLRLWELVDDDGKFWEEWPLEHTIEQSWQAATMGLKGYIPEHVKQSTIENLHIPFMS
jgi:hypothetical protein